MQHVSLDPLAAADSADLYALWSDRETVKFTNWTLVTSEEECAQRVQRMLKRYDPATGRVGPFLIRDLDGAFVGLIALDRPEPSEGVHELWYLLRRDRWSRGYGSAAVAEMLRRCRDFPQVKRIIATAVACNVASWRLLERNGFDRTGLLVGEHEWEGVKLDVFEYERALS